MKAWITLLTKPDYLPGVVTLNQSLRESGSRYPLVVMVTRAIDEATRRKVTGSGCLLREVTPLGPPDNIAARYAYDRFAEAWTKLAAWRFIEFERLVLLDADMLVLQNMDELFDIDLPAVGIAACHACRCNPNRVASYPADWVPDNCYYHYAEREDGSSPPADFIPYFNSGTVVLTPDVAVYDALLRAMVEITDLDAYPFPEQDLLNQFFQGRWQALPYGYNALKTLSHQHAGLWDMQQVKNLHFIQDKPWSVDPSLPAERQGRYQSLNRLWWKTFQSLSGE